MKKSGAQLAVHALEQIGVTHTFGIPGTHTTELYDQLAMSETITPVLVAHEGGGSFMADAMSRTSRGIGTLVIVPAAGLTHAMSGIAEAFLDGIPMLVIAGGVRRDLAQAYQLHGIDQIELARPVTKAQFLVARHEDIIPTIHEAYRIASGGEPGPVFIDLPVDLLLYSAEVSGLPEFRPAPAPSMPDAALVQQAADLLQQAKHPMLYLGWGSVGGFSSSIELAELLAAPVATTLQGKSAFPNSHALFTSASIGEGAKPSGQWALAQHDVMLAVGARFGEVATASYGLAPPRNLIHVDINPQVFNRNFHATLAIEADGPAFLRALLAELKQRGFKPAQDPADVGRQIQEKNQAYFNEWLKPASAASVQPGLFFKALQQRAAKEALIVTDDGHHTFLTAELFNVNAPRHFISPTDFNCMGYCVPALIAAKLGNPDKQVIGIVGDGAMLMTGLELTTAASHDVPVLLFIFNDGELGQISAFQKTPLNRKTCSVLSDKINFAGIAMTAGMDYIDIANDGELDARLDEAFAKSAAQRSVIVNVHMDYSQKTMLTKGALKVNLARMPVGQKARFIGRALKRHLLG